MIAKNVIWLMLGSLLLTATFAEAQPAKKMARVGYLSPQSGPLRSPTLGAFKEQLRELGWVEGETIEIEYRWTGGDLNKLSELATELVRLKVDAIVAGPGTSPTSAAKRITATIPIVMVGVSDPVRNGLVASLAHPGANVTGLTFDVTPEQAGKNLELLKEAVPKVSRVAILRNPHDSNHMLYGTHAERAAKIIGITIQFAELQSLSDKNLEDALSAVVNQRANALLVSPYVFFIDRRQKIIDFAARHKLPAIYPSIGYVNDGGLMVYGSDLQFMWRRAAVYVDKILKGTKPADLPVEQPMKFEFVINLKTAKQIGVTIPQSVLFRADRVLR